VKASGAGRAAGRLAFAGLRAVAALALLTAAAPVSLVAAVAMLTAWWQGWPPARLYRSAAWCAPMVAVWLAVTGAASGSLTAVAAAPYRAWLAMWHLGAAGSYPAAAAVIAPAAIPLGLAVAGLAWSARVRSMAAGAGGRSPGAAAAFDLRQWRHQSRAAMARIAAPGALPLTSRNGDVVAGAVIRSVGHPAGQTASLPYQRLRAHQVVIGTSGTGKTTLLLRLWAGFTATALRRHAAGTGPPPLLVVLDCKGGADSRRVADRARRVLRDAGARSTAIWPDEASLCLWALPPDALTTTLLDLVEHGTGAAAYYADVMEAVVALAVGAPCGPPASSADFLSRLDRDWLTLAYAAGPHDTEQRLIAAAGRQTGDIALRYRTLFRRLGAGLDGPGDFGDADAWYCILEGTAEISVAEAQARALVDLLAGYTIRPGSQRRDILLAVDEFSAVSRRLPIWQLYERARSLGLSVQVTAQSWQGLAATEDERYRIAAAADGGIWLLRTPHPEPAAALAGSRPVTDTSRQLLSAWRWAHRGSSRLRDAPVVDPALIRGLAVGQAAYIYRGGVTYLQVKRVVAAPAALPGRPSYSRSAAGEPAAAGQDASAAAGRLADASTAAAAELTGPAATGPDVPATSAGRGAAGAGTLAAGPPARLAAAGTGPPDASAFLDEVFGPEPES
jgi:hypothetical protein